MKRSVVVALSAAYSVGLLISSLLPVLIADYRPRLGLTETEAGLIATASLLSAAGAGWLLSLRVHRLPTADLARIGLGLASIGFALSAVLPGVAGLAVAQILSGAGCGAVAAVANAAIAATADPQKRGK